jgi:predicted CopG family antitoxin
MLQSNMASTMMPSQRRRAYKLKRIVISEHNYLALKRLGQAGDSFNDVISNLLQIERNHRHEKERKKLHEQKPHQKQQKNSRHDTELSASVFSDGLDSSSSIDEALENHRQQMNELFRTIEENRE